MLKGKRKQRGLTINTKQKELLNDFLKEGELIGYRKRYITGLRSRVPKLFVFLNEMGITISELGIKTAQEYQGWLIETGNKNGGKYCNNTILSYLGAASSFCEYVKRN